MIATIIIGSVCYSSMPGVIITHGISITICGVAGARLSGASIVVIVAGEAVTSIASSNGRSSSRTVCRVEGVGSGGVREVSRFWVS